MFVKIDFVQLWGENLFIRDMLEMLYVNSEKPGQKR